VRLDGLLRQAARLLPPAECNELIDLWARHLADSERARRALGGLQHKVRELRRIGDEQEGRTVR
jgi:hypothetical protein